jgi:hypothetical protein
MAGLSQSRDSARKTATAGMLPVFKAKPQRSQLQRGFARVMAMPGVRRGFAGLAVAAAAVSLAACSSMTYGTGTSPGMQTLKDISGIASLAGDKKAAIDYEPRPNVVAPPATTGSLPAPGAAQTQLASNWPVDPDEKYAKFKADVARLEAEGKTIDIKLPTGATPEANPYDNLTDAQRNALVKKLAKEARSPVAVDPNGNPVRRYLSDPPADYLSGDPAAPEASAEDKKAQKKKWWQVFASKD